jgi:hypothetical protein
MEREETEVAQAFATSSVSAAVRHVTEGEDWGMAAGCYSLAPLLYASSIANMVPMAKT